MRNTIRDILVIGAGNVAYHLVRALMQDNDKNVHVVARSSGSADRFANALPGARVLTEAPSPVSADLVILAVSDDGLQDAVRSLQAGRSLVVHTAGAVPMDVLTSASPNTGVFYPLQTLVFGAETDFQQVPLLLEANTRENLDLLKELAESLSDQVFLADSDRRGRIHLAAVFASNFSYHLYSIALEMMAKEGLPMSILHPLIRETARRAVRGIPGSAQTGPAVRGDMNVMQLHKEMLKDDSLYTRIYDLLSESIILHSNKSDHEL